MIMIQHPQRIQSRYFRNRSLLPVKPPEIYSFFLQRMMQILQIHFHKMRICRIKLYRNLACRINAHLFSDGRIQFFISTDTICRMYVQCNFHIMFMQPAHEAFWIREEVLIPGISCPSASVFWIHVVNQMPVHIHHCYREWQLFIFKTLYQFFIFFFCISMITAPPVTERISWKQRLFSAQIIKIFQTIQITMSISEEIQIFTTSLSRCYPAIFCQCH